MHSKKQLEALVRKRGGNDRDVLNIAVRGSNALTLAEAEVFEVKDIGNVQRHDGDRRILNISTGKLRLRTSLERLAEDAKVDVDGDLIQAAIDAGM